MYVYDLSAAEMQLCEVTNMRRTCELKLRECGQSEERVWLCVTDLWCTVWVMISTTPFHHLSPNNTWNSQNYISLAILCKIFTFSFLTLTPPSLRALCVWLCLCVHTQKRHLSAQFGLELKGSWSNGGLFAWKNEGVFKYFHSLA